MDSLEFTISPPPPSPNKMLRLHHFQYNRVTRGILHSGTCGSS